MPISIINKPQALALVGEWLREYRSVISSRLSVVGSESAGFQSAGPKPINRKQINLKQKTENRKLITGYPKIIVTPNPEIIVAAQSDPALMKALQAADLSIPDGIGVVWALGLPSRLSGLDLMESLMSELPRTLLQGESSKESPWKVMLLGGRPGVAQAAAATLQAVKWLNGQMAKRSNSNRQNPNSTVQPFNRSAVKILALSGPQNISNISRSENNRLVAQINSFQPDLLFVAFGHPKQEKWLIANRESLTVGVAMAVGGALDQIADPSLRPPPYINSIGLGWLYRLIREPWRWRRQLALVTFIFMIAKRRLSRNSRN